MKAICSVYGSVISKEEHIQHIDTIDITDPYTADSVYNRKEILSNILN